MDESRLTSDAAHHNGGHEANVVNMRFIVVSLLVLLLALLLVMLLMHWLLVLFEAESTPVLAPEPRFAQTDIRPPEPQIAADLPRQLKELRAENEETLSSYEWLDREKQVARIPIDRAIELLAEKGLLSAEPAVAEPNKADEAAPTSQPSEPNADHPEEKDLETPTPEDSSRS